jgi:hypothetical protein
MRTGVGYKIGWRSRSHVMIMIDVDVGVCIFVAIDILSNVLGGFLGSDLLGRQKPATGTARATHGMLVPRLMQVRLGMGVSV